MCIEREIGMEINLYRMFRTDTLRDRQTALLVVKEISKMPVSYPVKINFERIIFASRSFCHELLTGLKDRKSVKFENMNQEIKIMMEVALRKPQVDPNIPLKIMIVR